MEGENQTTQGIFPALVGSGSVGVGLMPNAGQAPEPNPVGQSLPAPMSPQLIEKLTTILDLMTQAIMALEKKYDATAAKLETFSDAATKLQEGVGQILAIAADFKAGQTHIAATAEVQHNTVQKIGEIASDLAPLVGLVQSIRLAIGK